MDKNAIGTNVIISTRSVKHGMMNIDTSHVQVTVFTFNDIGSNKNGESSVFPIKHGVKSLLTEAILSWDWFKYMTKCWLKCLPKWCYRHNNLTKYITFDQLHGQFIHGDRNIRGNTCIGTWPNRVYSCWSNWHLHFLLVVAYQFLYTGYMSMLVIQMAEQVGGAVGDNPCTLHPCTLIIIGSVQCLGTYNTNNAHIIPDFFEWPGKLSIKSKHCMHPTNT